MENPKLLSLPNPKISPPRGTAPPQTPDLSPALTTVRDLCPRHRIPASLSCLLKTCIRVGNVTSRFMPFIFIFREWERPRSQKIKNTFATTLLKASYTFHTAQKSTQIFKNIGLFKDFQK
ncbi:MAG TPA: hypothetical protein VG347_09005 [Verrucomicrobiae bacterium]|nr:hypothetical protein [Verrucomicrobiae bacterium]